MTPTGHRRTAPRRAASRAARPVIERASATDRAFLAMDTGEVPEQFGIVLLLDPVGGFDLARARRVVARRVAAVPRLRQRLVHVPFGCGAPIWADDPDFDVSAHVHAVSCPEPGDEQAALDVALGVIVTPLRRTAPLWSAVFVTGMADGRVALVVVLHHVLADGIGGLAVLAHLVDHGPGAADVPFPRPAPTRGSLALDSLRGRARAVRRTAEARRLLRASMSAGGGLRPPRAAPCSLVRRTGPRRGLGVVRADLEALRAAAHRHGATTNDAVLVAVAGALRRVLLARGESLDELVVTVPVSGRRTADGALGNMVSPLIVPVPATGDVGERLERVAAVVRTHKEAATGPPPIALLGWLFRPLAALGGYRWYMRHQHRFHTLVSHVRGPAQPLGFDGSPIVSAVPVGLGEGGNTTVYFEVLSYAGTLTVTAVVDPEHFPDLDTLTGALRSELDLVTRLDRPRADAPAP